MEYRSDLKSFEDSCLPEKFIPESASLWTKENFYLRTHYLLYNHPVTRKIAKVASYTFGVAALIAAAVLSMNLLSVICLGATGVVIVAVTAVASRIIPTIIPRRHDMKDHAFFPEQLKVNEKLMGELYYDGDVPILRIETDDPFEAGYTQGYLLQKQFAKLYSNIRLFHTWILREKGPDRIKDVLEVVKSKIPQNFLRELEGFVDGYNKAKGIYEKKLTVNDLLYLQLLPDQVYFNPEKINPQENASQSSPLLNVRPVACTLTALYDENDSPLMARTMDWMSYGNFGTLSLVISRLNQGSGIRTVEISAPGLIGTVTGLNSSGVSVVMNVSAYTEGINTIEGIPAAVYNRLVLESCHSFDDAKEFVDSQRPLGPYHLTVSDKTKAATFSMFQGENWTGSWDEDKNCPDNLRMLEQGRPLITTNCSYHPSFGRNFLNGVYREDQIKNYFGVFPKNESKEDFLKNSQSLPCVNNLSSTHRVLMGADRLELAVDNAWVGDCGLHKVNIKRIFGLET